MQDKATRVKEPGIFTKKSGFLCRSFFLIHRGCKKLVVFEFWI
ncbi:Uncharacterized protein dnm_100810 [Desulfonema magnum]|uniref:Uncharacterized protein n=1 Tax=Desulfonema magnum TaxID=45655 RepID=A0A975GUM3_9BACT|nr:Uncharacterized protein dnm_100810 [Desulfonema magnum]